jgi:hypothetical protein
MLDHMCYNTTQHNTTLWTVSTRLLEGVSGVIQTGHNVTLQQNKAPLLDGGRVEFSESFSVHFKVVCASPRNDPL